MAAKRKDAPKQRAPKGTGTVFYSKRRRCYVARKPIGTKLTKGGKRKTLYLERTGKTEREAIRRRDDALPPGPKTTVAEWAARWLESASVREQTRDLYQQSVNLRIVPQLGHLRVSEVSPFMVERAVAEWGKAVAATTVRKHLSHLRSLFGAAIRARLCTENPAAIAQGPRTTRPEIDPFTEGELERIVKRASRSPSTARLAVMAAIGCRIGEALALVPSDYHPRNCTLSITKNLTRSHGVGPPKSPNSVRTVRVPKAARTAAAELGESFTNATADRRWSKLLRELGIRTRGTHQARHSVASHALAKNVSIANVARDLGDRPEVILRTYTHATAGFDVCDAMESVLGGNKVAKERKNVTKRQGKNEKTRGTR